MARPSRCPVCDWFLAIPITWCARSTPSPPVWRSVAPMPRCSSHVMETTTLRDETVITGLGTIGPAGHGREPLAAALMSGIPLAAPVERDTGYHRDGGARLAAL